MTLTEEQREIALRVAEKAIIECDETWPSQQFIFEFAARFLAALPKPEPVDYQFQDREGNWKQFIDEQHQRLTIESGAWNVRAIYTKAPYADEQKPDLRAICIADENAFMKVLADRVVGNATPEEDSRLDVAYAIARHLKLDWPSAYESPIAPPASEQKPVWEPIATAPRDNKRPLYLARINENGELLEIDFDGGWDFWQESYEMPHVCGWDWCSANGIEEPTHWAFQDAPLPPAPLPDYKAQRDALLEELEKAAVAFWKLDNADIHAQEAESAIASVKGGA